MADRIAIELEVEVLDTPSRIVSTGEIGPGGLWLRGKGVPAPDRPVRLSIYDVDLGPIVVKGVVGQAPPGRDGVEVALFDNSPAVERRWRSMVERLSREAGLRPPSGSMIPSSGPPPTGPMPEPSGFGRTPTGPLPFLPVPAPQAEDAPPRKTGKIFGNRAHQRRNSQLRVTLRWSDGATSSATIRDVSEGGAFITAEQLPLVGERVDVCVAHPVTGSMVELPAEVVRHVDDSGRRGVGIKFLDDAAERVPWAVFGGRPTGLGASARRDRSGAEASLSGARGGQEER